MNLFTDLIPIALVGLTFTTIGGLKLWGLRKGIKGGACKPAKERLCGT
jgi:hypothetical protein